MVKITQLPDSPRKQIPASTSTRSSTSFSVKGSTSRGIGTSGSSIKSLSAPTSQPSSRKGCWDSVCSFFSGIANWFANVFSCCGTSAKSEKAKLSSSPEQASSSQPKPKTLTRLVAPHPRLDNPEKGHYISLFLSESGGVMQPDTIDWKSDEGLKFSQIEKQCVVVHYVDDQQRSKFFLAEGGRVLVGSAGIRSSSVHRDISDGLSAREAAGVITVFCGLKKDGPEGLRPMLREVARWLKQFNQKAITDAPQSEQH